MAVNRCMPMEIDWDLAKKQTLWHYEELTQKLLYVLSFSFVMEHYNHSMPAALVYAARIQKGYLQGQEDTQFIDSISCSINILANARVDNYQHLVQQVATREACVEFMQHSGIGFELLIQFLNYLFRWVLPFRIPLRELLDLENGFNLQIMDSLKEHGINANLDILEKCHTKAGRRETALSSGIAEDVLLEIVQRADLSRLAYVRGKTVKHLCFAGLDTLDKLANTDLSVISAAMDAYYTSIGAKTADYKAVIPLAWLQGGARILPRILEM